MSGEEIEMVRGKAALKLWAAPKLRADGSAEDPRLVDVEVDGWVLGPLHVADYDVMQTLSAMAPLGTAPPGVGAVSLYGLSIGLRPPRRYMDHPGKAVEEGKLAARVMWEHVLRHVIERVGDDEAQVVALLRQPQPKGPQLGKIMIEIGNETLHKLDTVAGATEAARRAEQANEAAAEAAQADREAEQAIQSAIGAAALALGLTLGLPTDAEAVPDVG